MDNSYLYYSPAEIEYRRQRASSVRRRREIRSRWLRRAGRQPQTGAC